MGLMFIFLITINSYSQEKKLPKGWDRVLLEGKTVYMNLVTGSISKRYPIKPAIKIKEEVVKEFDPTIVHVVKKGESLSSIAREYGFGLAKLYQLNSMTNFDEIEIGQEIVVGYAHNEEEKNAFLNGDKGALNHDDNHHKISKKKPNSSTAHKYHTVASGETLYRVASNYKLSVETLKKLNSLKEATIFIGQKLRIK